MPKKRAGRSAQGAGSIRQRPDGRWEARYTAGRNPGTGKQVQRSVYGDSQGEVLKKLQLIQAEAESGSLVEPSKMTVGQWLDIWTAEYLESVKPGTVRSYTGQIITHIKPALGAIKLQKLNPHDIQAFCNHLSRKKSLAPKSIKNAHGVLHAALRQAQLLGYIRGNPADNTALPRNEKPEITTLPDEVLPVFLSAIDTHHFGDLFYVAVFTGMRQSELLGLTWDCVDFDKGTVSIRRQLSFEKHGDERYALSSLKNDKPRIISPASSVMDRLIKRRVQQMEAKLKAGKGWSNPFDLVFTNEMGGHLTHYNVYKHFKKIVASLGYPDLRFHDMRHTYAVNALQSGDDIKTVQDNLGHHTAAFTLDIYGHVTEKMKRDSANRMEQFIQQIGNQKRS